MKKFKIPNKSNIKNASYKWIFQIVVFTFFVSTFLSIGSDLVLGNTNAIMATIFLFLIIFVGVLFDIVGTASTAANESPFHSMAAGNVKYAHNAIYLVRNAEKVAAYCNDVTGDIMGILSGTFATVIVGRLVSSESIIHIIIHGIFAAIVAALTIGGKGIGKTIALTNSNKIIYITAVLLKTMGINFKNKSSKNNGKNNKKYRTNNKNLSI